MDYPTLEKYATEIRTLIQRENEMINHRITWLATLQGLLFAATGVFWDKHDLAVGVMGLVAIGSCVSNAYTLGRANEAIQALLGLWDRKRASVEGADDLAPVIGVATEPNRWLLPWVFMPRLLLLAWVAILIFKFDVWSKLT